MISEFAYLVEREDDKVWICVSESSLPHVIECLEKLAKRRESIKKEEQFRRRVVPYFMNQFLLWSVNCKLKQVVKHLKDTRSRKTSKQKKFELGDLQDLFSKEESENQECNEASIQTQKYWKQFLQRFAEDTVLSNPKIKSLVTKQQYINEIPSLIQELSKLRPYYHYLSLPSIKESETQLQNSVDSDECVGSREIQEDFNQFYQWSQ